LSKKLWEFKNFMFGPFLLALTEVIKPSKVLDIGCSHGILVEMLRNSGVVAYGIDKTAELFNSSNAKEYLFKVDVDYERLPFDDEYFDTVVSLATFEHLHKPEHALNEIYRVLKLNGYLVINTPDGALAPHTNPADVSLYSFDQWRDIISQYGFKFENMRTNLLKSVYRKYTMINPRGVWKYVRLIDQGSRMKKLGLQNLGLLSNLMQFAYIYVKGGRYLLRDELLMIFKK